MPAPDPQPPAPDRGEAMILACWIARHPDIFGAFPAIIPAARHHPGVSAESWHRLGDHLAARLAALPEQADIALSLSIGVEWCPPIGVQK